MLIQARWDEMREKMQVIKDAYVRRHYTQCAKYGERLLAEVKGEVCMIDNPTTNMY
jgi:signal transduction protein with GAF and PtsI domain